VTSSDTFIAAATWHGGLDRADALLHADPAIARSSIFTAAVLGDEPAAARFLAADPTAATATAGPYGATALVYLCFSNYLRLDPARGPAFLRIATQLLDAGADPNGGFTSSGEHPEFESAIYGAAGVAHNAALTRLLLDRGADPNDNETAYHAAETYDNGAMQVLVESGTLNAAGLSTLLLRKTDWHDYDGITWLLEHGAAADGSTPWGKTALHNAILSDNRLEIVRLLLDHGANPLVIATRPERGSPRPGEQTAVQMAARRGRGDALHEFARRGFSIELPGVEGVLAACARADAGAVEILAAAEPHAVAQLRGDGGRFLAWFAGVDNADGVRLLLDLGVPVDAPFVEGEAYFDVAPNSLAIHVAAWRASHATVELLIDRKSPIDTRDGKGHTPLMLAVRACVDSWWKGRRSPESVKALLAAGASAQGIAVPSGYAEIDDLLRAASLPPP
jgi:ankyrin repeat protein